MSSQLKIVEFITSGNPVNRASVEEACLPTCLLQKWFLARRHPMSYLYVVKTASVQQVPERWPDILKWVASGEEVQMTDHDKVVATLVPADVPKPDFLNRAKAIWGENPSGKSLSAIVSGARGGER
jgi:antitoxin (DNA-binding transcriptional repressor) of toxin-antitoxin stability system